MDISTLLTEIKETIEGIDNGHIHQYDLRNLMEDLYYRYIIDETFKVIGNKNDFHKNTNHNLNTNIPERFYIKKNSQEIINDLNNGLIFNDVDRVDLTFLMVVKNRKKQAIQSIKSLIRNNNNKTRFNISDYINFLIVEAHSDDEIELEEEWDFIKHIKVDMDDEWNKSKLLNIGIGHINTSQFAIWDSDFLFYDNFLTNYINEYKHVNFLQYMMVVNSFEIGCFDNGGVMYNQGDPYGYFWTYKTDLVRKVGGFDEVDHPAALEDRDMEKRLNEKFRIKNYYTYPNNKNIIVFHNTHSNELRFNKKE